ncbi:MarR family winged helix-turn-helix transcriptional regulator [Roseobacteraceae bacterium S113]
MTQDDSPSKNAGAMPMGFAFFNEIGIINQLATALFAKCLPDGLHPSHFSILNHLSRLGDGKPLVRIAEAMQVSKNTMTHSIRVLEGRGFVRVAPNPEDGRGKCVFLTEAGRVFRDEAIARVMGEFSDLLGPEQEALMGRIMDDLVTLRCYLDDNRR